ncbi:MAG TPA: hypothetical protein VJ406_02810 [Dehalococcoidia bacterium]|nr:hypothetical protein [Dehalococcoidia bacterium]
MKKLISIGVVLAILAMVVVPVAVAAQEGCPDIGYDYPTTFAKIPFAILQSGIELVGGLLDTLGTELGLPAWLDSALLDPIAAWTGGPLGWTVDMLAWGMSLVAMILVVLPEDLGVPVWAGDLVNAIACGLFTPFTCNVTGPAFDPCDVIP